MGVFDDLIKEHRILEGIIRIMRRIPAGGTVAGRRARVSAALAILSPALEAHEEIEEAVLGIPTYATQKRARLALEAASAGHSALERMIKGAQRAAAGSGGEGAPLERTIDALAELLLTHFHLEEKALWPHYRRAWRAMSPSVHKFFRSIIAHRVQALEQSRKSLARRVR